MENRRGVDDDNCFLFYLLFILFSGLGYLTWYGGISILSVDDDNFFLFYLLFILFSGLEYLTWSGGISSRLFSPTHIPSKPASHPAITYRTKQKLKNELENM
jgi:hypothetical protein